MSSRMAWDLVRHSKNFYVKTYRVAGTALLFSIGLNLLLGLAVHYVFLRIPEPNYYATDGVTPPVMLTVMDEPNYTAVPLLALNVEDDYDNKIIPQ